MEVEVEVELEALGARGQLPSGFFENFFQKVPIICLSYSLWVLSNNTHQSDQKVPTGFISM